MGLLPTSRNYDCRPCPRFVYHFTNILLLFILFLGWTVFDKLYLVKGVLYIVSDRPSFVPDVRFIYSKALFIKEGQAAEQSRLPTQDEIRVISTKEAKRLFGTGAQTIDGVTVRFLSMLPSSQLPLISYPTFQFLVNDPPQLWVLSAKTSNMI